MTQLARRHNLTAVILLDEEFDAEECRRAMQSYCREVVLVPNPHGGLLKGRLRQLRSLASTRSFERLRLTVPALQRALDQVLRAKRFDIVNLEFSFLGHFGLRQAPFGERPPPLVVDSHNIDYELARQYARTGDSLARRLYARANWRKLRREELGIYRDAAGVYLCSAVDERRLLDQVPGVRTAVIPNAADVEYYQPRPTDPRPDGRTVVFFGLLSYVPNLDGVIHFVQDIWPRIADAHPDARLNIVGGRPPASLLALAGPRVELTGFVPDLRPHLAAAAAIVVPLRLGGGTRLKIVEAMAMGKAIVSTTLGAEGIEAAPGRDLLIEDQPAAFADAVNRLLADPHLAARIGHSARWLAVERYSWNGAAQALEGFYRRILQVGSLQRSGVGHIARQHLVAPPTAI
jgi:glycosyltransferase involved in cell wall biosynthesis